MGPMEMVDPQRSRSSATQLQVLQAAPPPAIASVYPNLSSSLNPIATRIAISNKADYLFVPPVGPGSLLAFRSVSAAESGSHKLQKALSYRFANELNHFSRKLAGSVTRKPPA